MTYFLGERVLVVGDENVILTRSDKVSSLFSTIVFLLPQSINHQESGRQPCVCCCLYLLPRQATRERFNEEGMRTTDPLDVIVIVHGRRRPTTLSRGQPHTLVFDGRHTDHLVSFLLKLEP